MESGDVSQIFKDKNETSSSKITGIFKALHSIKTSAFPATPVFKEILEVHGRFNRDLRTSEISQIPKTAMWSEDLARSILELLTFFSVDAIEYFDGLKFF